jgi:hypothetical protein
MAFPSPGDESPSSTIDPDTQARCASDGEPSAGFQSDLTIDEDAVGWPGHCRTDLPKTNAE